MFRFFKKKMKAGMPISTDGFMQGLQRLAEAWQECRVSCGHIEWREGHKPTIVIDPIMLTGTNGEIHPFKLVSREGTLSLYIPANSIIVNGKDFSTTFTGITEIGTSDFFDVSSFATTGLNMYISFDDTPSNNSAGKPTAVLFDVTPPSGKYVTIPILNYDATQGLYSLHHSQINYERTSFDGDLASPVYQSLEQTGNGGEWDNENHTLQIAGFNSAPAPVYPVFTDDTNLHHFPLREYSSGDGTYIMKWIDSIDLMDAIKADLTADTTWQSTIYEAWDDWYNTTDGRFWEKGADETVNYGTGIGNGSDGKIIDLTNFYLQDNNLVGSVDWKNRSLFNSDAGTHVMSWESRTLMLSWSADTSFKSPLFIDGDDNNGITLAGWLGGGIVIGTDIIEVDADDIQPTDKVLVRRL
jgi:hypothetical protein